MSQQPDGNINNLDPNQIAPQPQSPDGNISDIPVDNVLTPDEALKNKYSGIGNTIAAGLNAVPGAQPLFKGLRTGAAALGLSQEDIDKYIAPSPENIAENAGVHPIAFTIGGIGGTIAEGNLPIIGPLLRPIEGVGLGTKLIAGAAQGAGFNAANTAADDWSDNKPLDAERIMSAAGTGVLWGLGGTALFEGLRYTPSAVQSVINRFKDSDTPGEPPPPTAPLPIDSGSSFLEKAKQGAQVSGISPIELSKGLTSDLTDLVGATGKASEDMYENATRFHIGNALAQMPPEQAQSLIEQTVDKIKALSLPRGDEAAPNISNRTNGFLNTQLNKLISESSSAESSLDKHTTLRSFATKVGSLKFGTPDNATIDDQSFLGAVKNIVRGDLGDDSLWGDAAPVYRTVSDKFLKYKTDLQNLQKFVMATKTGPKGYDINYIDSKDVYAIIKNPELSGNIEKISAIKNFINSGTDMAQYAENYSGYQKGLNDLSDQIASIKENVNNKINIAELKQAVALAKKGNTIGMNKLFLFEGLPPAIKATISMLSRYGGTNGGYLAGSDLAGALRTAGAVGKSIGRTSNKIGVGVKNIFKEGQ